MLHVATPLFRHENLPRIHASLPLGCDLTWHVAKAKSVEMPRYDFLAADERVRVHEVDCSDDDISAKRNAIFDAISDGHFHLLDDDTIFHPPMLEAYLRHAGFQGMVIGKQLAADLSLRLSEHLPEIGKIDAGNVLCHSSVLRSIRWADRPGLEEMRCRDFVFWDNCHKVLGPEGTALTPEAISIYNYLR